MQIRPLVLPGRLTRHRYPEIEAGTVVSNVETSAITLMSALIPEESFVGVVAPEECCVTNVLSALR